jgi:hypothetical protein
MGTAVVPLLLTSLVPRHRLVAAVGALLAHHDQLHNIS